MNKVHGFSCAEDSCTFKAHVLKRVFLEIVCHLKVKLLRTSKPENL